MEFPFNFGFKYCEEYNEWQKFNKDGVLLILCEKNIDLWDISYLDIDDNIQPMGIGDEDYIICHFLNNKKTKLIL